jgi:acylphosphatase
MTAVSHPFIIIVTSGILLLLYLLQWQQLSNDNNNNKNLVKKVNMISSNHETKKMTSGKSNSKKYDNVITSMQNVNLKKKPASSSSSSLSSSAITTVLNFEVFGKVQRVSMRKYAKEAALKYKVRGWIKNTESKTVQGIAYGSNRSIKLFKKWLSTKGSPRSVIKSTSFEEREISEDDEVPKTFKIRKVLLANGKQWADR